jgi:hypothetical protein
MGTASGQVLPVFPHQENTMALLALVSIKELLAASSGFKSHQAVYYSWTNKDNPG